MKIFLRAVTIIFTSISLVACTYKPILNHNAKYNAVGEEQAQRDAEECRKEAAEIYDKYKAERAGKEAVRKGAIGAVIGTVFGFLVGGDANSTLGGAVIGTGVGATVGGLSVAGEDKVTPSEVKQRLMTRCLAEKGYEVIGWR